MPVRLRKLAKALRKHDVSITELSSGSHWKAERDGLVYPIPAHNGLKTEISDVYIRGVCRALGIDEKTLRQGL